MAESESKGNGVVCLFNGTEAKNKGRKKLQSCNFHADIM